MKNRLDKLTTKLVSSFIGITLVLMTIFALISIVIFKDFDYNGLIIAMFISFIVFTVLLVIAFSVIVHIILLKKINNLNNAVKETSKGNYDITIETKGNDELSELTDSFNKMTKELQANAFLSKDFARYVSHEFKTPLSVIRTYAELSQNTTKKDLKNNLNIIIEETDKLAGLSTNMLTLCKLDSTTIVKKEDIFIPATQIKNIVIALQKTWEDKNLDIAFDLENFEITNNENLIYLVWQNLIVNAIKFSNQKGKIEIRLKKNQDNFEFKIKDNGIGIKSEDADKIFQPFFMGDKSHNSEGHGLGLTLTKQITQKLSGTITFSSKENKGTEFIVKIPIK
jgi:signal transduction histidine kinase